MQGSQNHSNQGGQGGQGGGGNRRRRYRGNRGQGQTNQASHSPQSGPHSSDHRPRPHSGGGRHRRGGSKPLGTNQILIKYDNLLEQHLISRKKYFEYFNRVDERQLYRLEKNFFDSIEHLRRFEQNLDPRQREILEKLKTDRYRPDLTYSLNRNLDPLEASRVEVAPEEIEDPHFKESQKEAFEEYKNDTEESMGTIDDYLKLKGLK